jgi:hypothetical protein
LQTFLAFSENTLSIFLFLSFFRENARKSNLYRRETKDFSAGLQLKKIIAGDSSPREKSSFILQQRLDSFSETLLVFETPLDGCWIQKCSSPP